MIVSQIVSQGRVTLVQLSGKWREGLRKLPEPYSLTDSTVDAIIRRIEQNPPLALRKGLLGWKELGPYDVDGRTELTYTNHHYFLTAWIITPEEKTVPVHEILDYEKLGMFYRDGLDSLRSGLIRSFWLPKDLKVIYINSPMPDVVIGYYFPGQLNKPAR